MSSEYAESVNRKSISRRQALQAVVMAAAPLPLHADDADPWTRAELMQSVELAKRITGREPGLRIICVTFPVLYRQRHIRGALLAGPGSKPDGIAALQAVLRDIDKAATVILYCGCCPMPHCPNIRPAFREAEQSGFRDVRVLNLPTSLHTDWVSKGYPVAT